MDQLLGVFLDLGNNPAAVSAITVGGAVLVGVSLLWIIGSGIAAGAARARKRHDVALHAADTLSRLYGIVVTVGKSGSQLDAATCESLTLQLCAGRTLGKSDMGALLAIRQLVLMPRDGGAAFDMAKFTDNVLHLSRVLSGAAPNPLPGLKLAQKQLHDVTAIKASVAAPAKAAEPAVAKKPEAASAAASVVTPVTKSP